jgi:hypothetical protein
VIETPSSRTAVTKNETPIAGGSLTGSVITPRILGDAATGAQFLTCIGMLVKCVGHAPGRSLDDLARHEADREKAGWEAGRVGSNAQGCDNDDGIVLDHRLHIAARALTVRVVQRNDCVIGDICFR